MMIMMRNGYIETPRPRIVPFHTDAMETDRAQRDEALNRAGVRFTKEYFIRTYHFEEDDIEDTIVDESKLQTSGFEKKSDKANPIVDVDKESKLLGNKDKDQDKGGKE